MRAARLAFRRPPAWLALLLGLALAGAAGCSPARYRRMADRESYALIGEHESDPRWLHPDRPVEAHPKSRMRDYSDPDFGPLPPDDPAAHVYMHHPYKFRGWKHWHDRGDLPSIEYPEWLEFLPRTERGDVDLRRDTAMQLALLHSREYQTQVESVYFQALALSVNRFEFDTRYFAGVGTQFTHFGNSSLPGESNQLRVDPAASVRRNLAGGGQLLVDFANRFVWEFTGDNVSSSGGNILVTFTQPLLRGAFKQVRLENLTQSERDMLYSIRDFTRFRRVFYVDIMSSSGFLGLLGQVQGIRNQLANLLGLERSLLEHEALAAAGQIAPIQVDQIFQQYTQARRALLGAQRGFETSLDGYKIRLGLPPQLEVALNDSPLDIFTLNDPGLDELIRRNERFRLALLQPELTPSTAALERGFAELFRQQDELAGYIRQTADELKRWRERIAAGTADPDDDDPDQPPPVEGVGPAPPVPRQGPMTIEPELLASPEALAGGVPPEASATWSGSPDDTPADPAQAQRLEQQQQRRLSAQLDVYLADLEALFADDRQQAQADAAALSRPIDDPFLEALRNEIAWQRLRRHVGSLLRERLREVFVIQTQVRVYSIELTPVELNPERAVQIALGNRLDLMNVQAEVIDAYRRVIVAANALKGDLGLRVAADLSTDPDKNNAFRFDASANRYEVGVQFDSPLTRLIERNNYRASQIQYQQARRRYMAAKDAIAQAVRRDLRELELNRFQFEIGRQRLIAAARQVDLAQVNLRSGRATDSSATQDLLNALQNLLGSKDDLISGWVSYETSRMNLYRDLDLMEINEDGEWVNEREPPPDTGELGQPLLDRIEELPEPPLPLDALDQVPGELPPPG